MRKESNLKKLMEKSLKKNGLLILLIFGMLLGLISCKHQDDDDEFIIIDYYPVEFEILVVNSAGENLLEELVEGNILNSEMYIELAGERYDVAYGRPDEPFFPNPVLTRDYMPMWYGAFIAPYFYQYHDLPERGNRMFIGEFEGDASKEVKFDLYLDGHTYEISYFNKKISGLDIEREYYLNGNRIESSSFTLTL